MYKKLQNPKMSDKSDELCGSAPQFFSILG